VSSLSQKLHIRDTPIAGVFEIERIPMLDPRGEFSRLFCQNEIMSATGRSFHPVQVNLSVTSHVGSLRGLHYQKPPHEERKLVSCISGSVWDVAVDLRKQSPTFGKWYARELSADNRTALLIPEGVAHGFQALKANSTLLYLHSALYNSQADAGIRYDDPKLAIAWPLPVNEISDRDLKHPMIDSNF
jgi:dTDP-4-dehydrorhamnose 3,5-epimerase